MFWVKISQATAKGDLTKFSPLMILAVTGLGTAVITSFLVSSFILAVLLRLPRESIFAVTVLSSARNSSIGITVIGNLPDRVGDKDLMFFPIIFACLAMMIIINSFGYVMTTSKDESNHEQQDKETEEKVDDENKLTLVITPAELITLSSQHIKTANDDIELSPLQWCTYSV